MRIDEYLGDILEDDLPICRQEILQKLWHHISRQMQEDKLRVHSVG